MPIDTTLHKEKYRTRKLGVKNGQYKQRTGNSHNRPKRLGVRPRARRYPDLWRFSTVEA